VRLLAKDDRIEIVMEGLAEDEGRVRLNAFMSQLQRLGAALAKLDRETNDGKIGNVFQIAELSYSSPVRVVLQAKPVDSGRATGHLVVEGLRRVTDAIVSGADLSGLDAELLEDIKGLAAPIGRVVKNTTLIFNGSIVDLTPRMAHQLEDALAVEDECDGSLEGDLDQINVHQGANIFHIYPHIGPRRVTCHFPPGLLDDAVAAVGRRIEVYGSLKYRYRAPFPHQIDVTGIEVLPSDDELPDWDDLRGRAPDATGELSSEAFVRGLRDAW
jgi:hypothetical protein